MFKTLREAIEVANDLENKENETITKKFLFIKPEEKAERERERK